MCLTNSAFEDVIVIVFSQLLNEQLTQASNIFWAVIAALYRIVEYGHQQQLSMNYDMSL